MHLVQRIQKFKREAQPKYGLLAKLLRILHLYITQVG